MLIGTHGVEVGLLGVVVGVRVDINVNVGVSVSGFDIKVGGKGGGVTPPPETVVSGTGVTVTNVGEVSVKINVGGAPVLAATVVFPQSQSQG